MPRYCLFVQRATNITMYTLSNNLCEYKLYTQMSAYSPALFGTFLHALQCTGTMNY